ncbi:hypothetical protein Dsin_013673 [Dipteronia sinensis]|uniref:AAA+ ATPase domain-containing protein n=1 Tax=Dipteronia sinensis TaxID=43782 RepID=A0AAE0AKE8_9ROSI|nr:hypothetical protein Dsin_013673 [Dipteronia sinensis]
MDLVSPVLDVFNRVWYCIVRHSYPIRHLRENLQSLEEAKRELEDINRDVESNVRRLEEQQHSRRTNQVKGWLEAVDRTLKEVRDTLQRGDQEVQNKCFGNWCPKNCCSTYKLGNEVIKKLNAVKELAIKRHDFDVVADKLPPAAVDVRPMEKTVGTESRFSQLWRYVQDHSVGIIGIYGMGGVGKTTLLKKLNNKFMDTKHDFDLVIWVVVSKEVNLQKIQEVIRKKVEISDEMWKQIDDEGDRASELYKRLSKKKFVLLLDDIWQRIDLSKMGVPVLDKCKIVFTTRSEDVCNHMEAHERFKVECLSPEVAWELFQQKLGKDALNSHHEIPKLAKIVVNECKGLPLALITIGRAMASRRKLEEWQHAINLLQSYPSEFPGMEDTVLLTLKFSYDSLTTDILKSCFIYCSIYPEDHDIDEDEIIDLWIGEGFLRDIDNIYDARNEGKYIIGSLKLACLLETGREAIEIGKCYVKMHDVLRDMALWIASEQKSKILVQEYVELSEVKSSMVKWTKARRISLWRLNIATFTKSPSCSCLLTTTLFVRDTDLVRFPNNFFRSMCALIVLDLSRNEKLIELPAEIGELINLQYLNVSFTNIKTLPIEVKKLRQLRILRFEDTLHLQNIPAGVIPCLSSLQVFYWFSNSSPDAHHVDISLLQELEGLEHIKDISLMLCSLDCIDKLFSSPKLKACVTSLRIRCPEECSSLVLDISSSTMKRMKNLEIIGCNSLKELKFCGTEDDQEMRNNLPSLKILYLRMCPIKDLTSLIHVPSLLLLVIGECPSLTEVIACDFGSSEIKEAIDIFPNLQDMTLIDLPNLKSICRQAMPFPSLKRIEDDGKLISIMTGLGMALLFTWMHVSNLV